MTGPEKIRSSARKRLRDVGRRREAAVRQLVRMNEELAAAVVDADGVGIPRVDIADMARVSRTSVYNWIEAVSQPRRRR